MFFLLISLIHTSSPRQSSILLIQATWRLETSKSSYRLQETWQSRSKPLKRQSSEMWKRSIWLSSKWLIRLISKGVWITIRSPGTMQFHWASVENWTNDLRHLCAAMATTVIAFLTTALSASNWIRYHLTSYLVQCQQLHQHLLKTMQRSLLTSWSYGRWVTQRDMVAIMTSK